MRKLSFLCLLVFILLASSACQKSTQQFTVSQSSPASPIELNISAALGMKEVLLDVQKEYELQHPNIKIIYNFAAAGILASQIEQGAQADIFISAANKQIDDLAQKNLVIETTRQNLASNKLVLIVPQNSSLNLNSFQDLTNINVSHFGMGELETVPAGQYGREVLQYFGVWEQVKGKAVLAKDVRTILSYVETGNAEAGIVFSTVAATSDKVKVVATAPADSHTIIQFPCVIVTGSKNPAAAQDFINYMLSPAGKQVLEKYGFQTNMSKE